MPNYFEITENNQTTKISYQEYLEKFKAICEEIASSEESTKEIIINAGIRTKDGELAPQYR